MFDGGVAAARERKVEKADMPCLSRGHAVGHILCRRDGLSRRTDLAFTHQNLGLARMGEGEARVGGECTVERLERAGIYGEQQLVTLDVRIPCGGGGGGHGELIAVCDHRRLSAKVS